VSSALSGRRLSSRFALVLAAAALLTTGVASCRGCGSERGGSRPLGGRLSLFPAQTTVVASIDFAKLRSTPLAAKLAQLAVDSQSDQREIETFTKRTGLDPLKQVESLVLAFPEEARREGEFGMVLRASVMDETRLIAYTRDQLQKSGDDLVATARGHRTLWWRRSNPEVAGFFIDDHTFVLGAGGWAARMADLSEGGPPSGSAETNVDLVRLCERAAGGHAVWAAALVPGETRRMLQAEPRFKSAASVTRMAAGLDVSKGLDAVIMADLANSDDAVALAGQVTQSLRDAKKNAEILMLGLGPYLEGVSTKGVGSTFEVRVALTEPQVGDLLDRAAAYLKLAREGSVPGFRGR